MRTVSGHFVTLIRSSSHLNMCIFDTFAESLHCINTFFQRNFNTTLDRVLSLVIICGMGLDGGATRHGDHTSMVSTKHLLCTRQIQLLNCRLENQRKCGFLNTAELLTLRDNILWTLGMSEFSSQSYFDRR